MDSYKVIKFNGSQIPKRYEALLYSKLMRSLRYGNEYFRLIVQRAYYDSYNTYIKSLLERPGVVVRLAVLSDDDDVVLGWSLMEGSTLHYVYVNREYRKTGIGTTLVAGGFDTFTHITNIGMSVWSKKYPKAEFNPFK